VRALDTTAFQCGSEEIDLDDVAGVNKGEVIAWHVLALCEEYDGNDQTGNTQWTCGALSEVIVLQVLQRDRTSGGSFGSAFNDASVA
jgi:hypothetical protein